MSLNAIAIPSAIPQAKALIVTLHGWGANAQDLASLAPLLDLPDYAFVFPDAPLDHPQVPGGRMWYDLGDLELEPRSWGRDREDSCALLLTWLQELAQSVGVPLNRCLLCGFSQGGAMAIEVGWQLPLAGVVSLSGYLQTPDLPAHDQPPPIAIGHGVHDLVVPIRAARHSRDRLLELGASVTYREFDMSHEICPPEILWWRDFIQTALQLAPAAVSA